MACKYKSTKERFLQWRRYLNLLNDSFNYLDDYVRSLDIDKRLKEFLLHQISEDPNKEYLGDHIDLVSSNKRFIK